MRKLFSRRGRSFILDAFAELLVIFRPGFARMKERKTKAGVGGKFHFLVYLFAYCAFSLLLLCFCLWLSIYYFHSLTPVI